MVGDWRGSLYGITGRRWDLFLFLDHDGRYARTVRMEPDQERNDRGNWEYDADQGVLHLHSDTPNEADRASGGWQVLTVNGCEDSNVLLVLREIVLASRNLPIVLCRVHGDGRGYGSDVSF